MGPMRTWGLAVYLLAVGAQAQSTFHPENLGQVGGAAVLTGNGTTGTGSPRVTISQDNTAFPVNATLQTSTATVGAVDAAVTTIDLTATSPAAASTVVGAASADVTRYKNAQIVARLQGATGGALDVYLQTQLGASGPWSDVCHFTQLAAAAAAIGYAATSDRSGSAAGGGTPFVPVVVNSADGTPVLAAGKCTGQMGSAFRVVFVAGAGTSAGASQTVKLLVST